MQKTGSSALVAALLNAGFEGVQRRHFIGPQSLTMRRKVGPAAPASLASDRAVSFSEPDLNFAMVTCVRDPIAQMISNYFQFVLSRHPTYELALAFSGDAFMSWCDQMVPPKFQTWWFDDNLKTMFGFDFRAHPFDRARRSVRFVTPRLRLLCLRQEDPKSAKELELGWLVGCASVALPITNVTSEKPAVAATYDKFVSSFRPPGRWVDSVYRDDVFQHFYSAEERETFRSRWSSYAA